MLVRLIVTLVLCFVVILYYVWRVRFGYPPPWYPRVLAYHKVTNFEFGGTWMTPGRFERQIDALIKKKFRFIDEKTFLQIIEGERNSAGNEVFLTFDDGYVELLDTAVPVLRERKIPAHFFIVTSYVGQENKWELPLPGGSFMHMSWDDIRQLSNEGFTFGSHTCSHLDLTRLPSGVIEKELRQSREDIEEHLNGRVKTLSFPFGRVNPEVKKEAKRAGYRAAFTLYPGGRDSYSDKYVIRREGVYIIDTIYNIKAKLGRGPLFWVEDLKGRAINAVAVLTPILKQGQMTEQ